MSDHEDELEPQALERQLDDAFETTRPRPAFSDELWTRIASSRPAPSKLRDALAAFWRGVRTGPAVPAGAVALVLIVALGVGIVALNGMSHGGPTATSGESAGVNQDVAGQRQYFAGSFGKLPSPSFSSPSRANGTAQSAPQPGGGAAQLTSPVRYSWTGTFVLNITTAPVFRYSEPGTEDADHFASSLGAVLRGRPSGFLGTYSASDYSMRIRGTVQSPPSSPAYFIFSGLNMPAADVAGGPEQAADVFLAQHNLTPPWLYTVAVDSSGDPVKVIYERQLDVPGYGPAYLLNANGNHYGMEVDFSGGRPVLASGMLPLNMDVANYNVVGAQDAIREVTVPPTSTTDTSVPAVQLNHAELVYVLVPAGDHSFFEPAFLFTGMLQTGGKSYTEQVLISAVDPSQRTR
jgi:hypothetical protein